MATKREIALIHHRQMVAERTADTMRFSLIYAPTKQHPGGYRGEARHTLADATKFGWEIRTQGRALLLALEVGGRAVDDDGDAWERVE